MTIRLFFFSIFSCAAALMQAQKITVSEPLSIRNDYGYEIIGRMKDRILLFRDRYDNYEIQAFDPMLRSSWSQELEDIDRRGTRVLGVIAGKNDFSIVYAERKRGKHYLKIHKYDPEARLIDSITIKYYGERPFTPPVFEILISENRTVFTVYNTAERNELEAICFRVDQMKVLWDKTAVFENSSSDRGLRSMALSNTGDLYVISEFDNRKGKAESHRFQSLRISERDDEIRIFKVPDLLTSDVKFVFDNRNQRLVGAGLWAEKNKERANGVFFLSTKARADSSFVFRKTPFDDQFISTLRRKEVTDDTKGITDADVSHVLLREDGGVALVAERHYEVQRGTSGSSRIMRDVRLIVDYYYDDVFLLGMGPDGTLQWNTILHKKQYSQDDDGIFSSFFLMRNYDRFHFLFNDEIRYENTCSEYEISANGNFDRNSIMNTQEQGLRLRFRDGVQISANECVIPSEYRSKLKLVTLRY